MRVIIYNGDADACVPYLDNEAWVESLGFSVTKPWTAWQTPDAQVGGYVIAYANNNFTFATARASGHMVRCVGRSCGGARSEARARGAARRGSRRQRVAPAGCDRPPPPPLPPHLPPSALPTQVPQFTPSAGLSIFNALITNTPLA